MCTIVTSVTSLIQGDLELCILVVYDYVLPVVVLSEPRLLV